MKGLLRAGVAPSSFQEGSMTEGAVLRWLLIGTSIAGIGLGFFIGVAFMSSSWIPS